MHCMGHWYAIRGVKACSSFRWIKQFTHLSVAKLLIESKNRGRVIPVLSMYSPAECLAALCDLPISHIALKHALDSESLPTCYPIQ